MSNFNWHRLVAHNHWVTIAVHGRKLNLCARCLGVIVGFSTLVIATLFLKFTMFLLLPPFYQLCICVILILPAIYDWLTQSWGFRESTNKLRVSTGVFEGMGAAFLSITPIPPVYKIIILILIGGLALNLGLLQKHKLKPSDN